MFKIYARSCAIALTALALFGTTLQSSSALAQDDDEIGGTLEDMLGIKSSIATKRALTPRESPGIVSVITRDDIANSGARDVKEILSMFAPGYAFAVDVEGVVGVGVRGLWGHEGKVLLMMDGVPLNEDVYGNTAFGNHYPAELVEKIEVIRGPGSVIHGGYAMIGVVNIVTRGVNREGFVIAARRSEMSDIYSHSNVTGGVGGTLGDFKYDLTVSGGAGNRSQETMVDAESTRINLQDQSKLDPFIGNLGLSWKGLTARAIFDRYNTTHAHFGPIFDPAAFPYRESFESRNVQVAYRWDINDVIAIRPHYGYRATYPWKIDTEVSAFQFNYFSERNTYGADADIKINDSMTVLTGVEYSDIYIRYHEEQKPYMSRFQFDAEQMHEEVLVGFAELAWQTGIGNFTIGGRYERPKNSDAAFVPRIAFTKAYEKFHYKLLASQSFRPPEGVQPNRVQNQGDVLLPEVATNLEVEAGYRFSESLFGVVNIFDIRVKDPIAYLSNPVSGEGLYDNTPGIGSTGAEAELRFKEGAYDFGASVAYYQRAHDGQTIYSVPNNDDAYLGFANWQANLFAGYRFTRSFGIYPSVKYMGERYGFVGTGSAGADLMTVEKSKPVTLLNCNLRYTDLFVKGLNVSAGVMNITDQHYLYYEAYDSGLNPGHGYPAIPALSRAYNASISYSAQF